VQKKLLLLLLLEALQLQRSFSLPDEFLPFDPVSDAVLPVTTVETKAFTAHSEVTDNNYRS
jgi:hypothetical protein